MPPPNPFAPRDHGHFEPLSKRVLIWRNIVNSTVVVGERGVAVVDTQVNAALARRLLAAIRQELGQEVLYAINTHYHWDHTSGNAVFAEAGAQLVSSRRTALAMRERAQRQKGFLASRGFELGDDPRVPDLQLDGPGVLDLGGTTLHIEPGLPAETADPSLVWCPQERVLIAGDTVMTGSFPIFGQPSQREGLEDDAWLAALDQVRSYGAEVVSPGHGPPARPAELDGLERIIRYFLEQVRRHHQAGRSLDETITVMEEEMPAWISRIPEVWGTPRYAILRVWAGLEDLGQPGWQHRKPSAIPRSSQAGEIKGFADQARLKPASAFAERLEALLEGGAGAQAVSLAETITDAWPEDALAWTLLARTLVAVSRGIASVLEKGDCFEAAKAALARALRLDPGHGPALLQAGQFQVMMAFRNGDDPARGEALLQQAAAWPGLSPRQRAELAFYRGIAARSRQQETEALALFRAALADDPGFRPALLASMP